MTNEEAISELKDRYLSISCYADKEACNKANKAIDMAIQALEKQIPKKPLHWDDCEQFYIECPCCGKRYDSRLGYKGCPYCLQAIRLE